MSISTLLVFTLYGVLDAISNLDFYFVDNIVNSICLMLMSPYYSGSKDNVEGLYRTLCKLCIFCCCQVQNSFMLYHKDSDIKLEVQTPKVIAVDASTEVTTV